MEAFQLKIMIKDVKPPVWRRVIVPSGITFTQLSMIINKVMGLRGYKSFEFQFYKLRYKFIERVDLYFLYDGFDHFDSCTTYIREFMEKNKSYTYNFGESLQYSVSVEKVLDDYEKNYPQVIKYKGEFYFEEKCCNDVLYNNINDYEYYGEFNEEDIVDENFDLNKQYKDDIVDIEEVHNDGLYNGTEKIDFYDVEEINKELKEKFFYKWGKGEKRLQRKILKDFSNNKYGLRATKTDDNKFNELDNIIKNIYSFEEMRKENDLINEIDRYDQLEKENYRLNEIDRYDQLEKENYMLNEIESYNELNNDYMEMIEECITGMEKIIKKENEKYLKNDYTLKKILSDYKKSYLLEIANNKNIKNIKKCKKDELIDILVDFMLQPEEIRKYFVCIKDRDIEILEKIIRKEAVYEQLISLYEASYVTWCDSGLVVVSSEVIKAYEALKNDEFEQDRKKTSYLVSCIELAEILYGQFSIEILEKVVCTNPHMKMSEKEIYEKFRNIPSEFIKCIIDKDMFSIEAFYDNDELVKKQGDIPYYIPTANEVMEWHENKCFLETKESKKLEQYLVTKCGVMREESKKFVKLTQINMCLEYDINDIIDEMYKIGIYINNQKTANELIKILEDLKKNTRMMMYRGFTKKEINTRRNNKKGCSIEKNENNVINFEQAKKNKIYPNDLCPCGSGKKYKKCCKKN